MGRVKSLMNVSLVTQEKCVLVTMKTNQAHSGVCSKSQRHKNTSFSVHPPAAGGAGGVIMH